MSWVATSNIVLYQKARPVFVDVDPLTGIIDENKIEEKITDKTKAILIVHLYGQMVDMRKLKEISEKYKIPVIEDCAHSVESARDGIRPGELGFAACFSFHAAKNITSGQGGAYVTNNQADADKIRLLRRDGVINKDGKRIMLELGYKYDLTDFQAALLLGQLKKIKQSHKKRLKVISNYKKLCEEAGLDYVKSLPNSVHAGHMFLIKVSPDKRDFLRGKMAEAGIDTSIHYPPIHLEPFYRKTFGYKEGDFPNAEKFGASVITLPTYPSLTLKEQKYIFSVINKSLK
jgi:dTDP-4-amino-4,6-dideoxygalactose transaminase